MFSHCPSSVGDGGAPPVAMRSLRSSGLVGAFASLMSMMSTVGAPLKCVTPSSAMSFHTSGGAILRSSMFFAPTPVSAHGEHQPVQGNIGGPAPPNTDVDPRFVVSTPGPGGPDAAPRGEHPPLRPP